MGGRTPRQSQGCGLTSCDGAAALRLRSQDGSEVGCLTSFGSLFAVASARVVSRMPRQAMSKFTVRIDRRRFLEITTVATAAFVAACEGEVESSTTGPGAGGSAGSGQGSTGGTAGTH